MTSYRNKRQGFTLVELLVVVTIIAMLAGMLIPAVNYAREAGRRTQCINHQRNLVIAMNTHAANEGALPGSLNQLGKYTTTWTDHNGASVHENGNASNPGPRVFSWVVALLPYIEENSRYEVLMAGTPNGTRVGQALGRIPVLFCTSARLDSFTSGNAPRLSYVVNCGPEAASGDGNNAIDGHTAPAFTIFRDRRSHIVSSTNAAPLRLSNINRKFKLEDIKDGASNTILLSENMQAWTWYFPNSAVGSATNTWDGVNEFAYTSGNETINTRGSTVTASLGFVWSNRPTDGASTTSFFTRINEDFNNTDPSYHPLSPLTGPMSTTRKARPSSRHPGLVVMGYADGTARVMNDDVGRGPYLKAVCPNDLQAENNTNTHTSPGNGLGYSNNDFQKENW